MKKILLKILFFPYLSSLETEKNQLRARKTEWEAIKPFLRKDSFLDVGCGAGDAMVRAQNDFDCDITGIDPEPNKYGVGRNIEGSNNQVSNIIKGFADNLPFSDKSMGIIYSSHVLEHIKNKDAALNEMSRVLRNDGVLIIGMPTATMAVINLLTNYLFLTHIKIISIFSGSLFTLPKYKVKDIILPVSHSFTDRSVYSDIGEYRITKWEQVISDHFSITKVVKPALYSYPEFIQFIPFLRNFYFSSSVFFICSKK